MEYLKSHTYLAYSQALSGRKPVKISESVREKALELSERMTIGYVSFRCGIPVADVVNLLEERRRQA